MNILDEIVEYKKKQIEEEKKLKTLEEYMKEAEKRETRNFLKSLRNSEKMAIISEIKKASPSKGVIKENFSVEEAVEAYEKEDFSAYSVLTERKYFQGRDEYINVVKKKSERPVLRKDFITDEYQVYQAKAIGADAVLLIAAVLKDRFTEFFRLSESLGLCPLTEIHSAEEIKYIEESNPYLIGINNRNLETFRTDIKHTEEIIKHIPDDRFVISESGIKNAEDLKYLRSIGVRGALIGESLMRNLGDIKKIF